MPTLANRYQLLEPIYHDQAVIAYRARDQVLHRMVTLETLSDQASSEHAERLVEKARRAALDRTPNVAKLYDQNIDVDRPFLVWEDRIGPTIAEAAPLPESQAINIVDHVANMLQAALAQQRSLPRINPQTLCIDGMGRLQLLNLGLPPATADQQQAIGMLGDVLDAAVKLDVNTRSALRVLIERTRSGAYPTVQDFVADLHRLQQRHDAPTTTLHELQRRDHASTPAHGRFGQNSSAYRPATRKRRWPRVMLLLVCVGGLLLALGVFGGGNYLDQMTGLLPVLAPTAPTVVASTPEPPLRTPPPATPTPQGEEYVVNTITGQPVRVRSGPGLSFDTVGSVPFGDTLEVIGGPQPADGYTWVQIRFKDVEGWCISEALQKR